MNYRTLAPPEILKSLIRYIWVLEDHSIDNSSKTFGPLADGCPGIMFQLSEKGTLHDEDNRQLPGVFLYGQTIGPVKMHSTGNMSTIGICFYPHALKSVFGFDAHELTSSCIDLNLISHKKESRLSEQLLNAVTIDEQVNRLSSYLFAQVRKTNRQIDPVMQYALSQITNLKGDLSLKELHHQLQLSERSLERKFKQSVGISPKLFSRICRFQEALKQLRKDNFDKLSDIAYENGYADQSHFIRSFKEFTGFSPYEYKKQSNEVAENFLLLTK